MDKFIVATNKESKGSTLCQKDDAHCLLGLLLSNIR